MNSDHCTNCGAKMDKGANYCTKCGNEITVRIPVQPSHAKNPQKKILVITAILLSMFLAGVIIVLLATAKSGNIDVGPSIFLAEKTITTDGGEIRIDGTGTGMDGLLLSVPKDAYDKSVHFVLRINEIKAHSFGELFNPVTPLISIDCGHDFANAPMVLNIPIKKSDDAFAMAFYYDSDTGKIEGIPCIEQTNDSITIITSHFSNLAVSVVNKGRITDEIAKLDIDTGFKPGWNDFQMPNHGSYICPNGHCAGQSIAAMFYYNSRARIGWDKPLYGRYDNNEMGPTGSLEWDDARAIRLCSLLQEEFSWSGYKSEDDEDTYFAFAYAMILTKEPQFIAISSEGGGHAMIIYKATENALYVADPNFPGEERKINYVITDGEGDLQTYYSGSNAEEATTDAKAFDSFSYYGLYSLISIDQAQQAWAQVMNKQNVAQDLFPPDLTITAATGRDASGNLIYSELTDNFRISAQQLNEIGNGNVLTIPANEILQNDDALTVYTGDVWHSINAKADPEMSDFIMVPLKKGDNDLGFNYMKMKNSSYEFVNFYRYNVVFNTDISLRVSPESATVKAGETVAFQTAVENGPDTPLFLWYFGDEEGITTEQIGVSHTYKGSGIYHGSVTLVNGKNPDDVLAFAEFTVSVQGSPTASDTVLPTKTGSTADNTAGTTDWVTILDEQGSVGGGFYDTIPEHTPSGAGTTLRAVIPGSGRIRITAEFASDVSTGPRFVGDEMGYRSQAIVFVKYNDGTQTTQTHEYFNNGYDNDYSMVSIDLDIPAAQTISIQIVPQGLTCYSDNQYPASDGDAYLFYGGKYKLSLDFLEGGP